ncbi:MAG: ParB/RepB/Spo0J family partition protein [Ruminococcaceae bacterium]|nr:ParB/RepB/Spo0J family partition protein [Oscillospiraceae bacterium]
MPKPKNTGLGRGLDAIFMDNFTDGDEKISTLRISEVEPRMDQPRKSFDPEALKDLADSISVHGLLQPLIVKKSDFGMYQIVAGERRWRAAKMAGLNEVPVIVMELDDKAVAEIALIENVQREDLNPVEEAKAYRSLVEEYGLTQEELSKRIGKNRSTIANTMRLTELEDEVLKLLEEGSLSAGHARALLALKNTVAQVGAARETVQKGLSVRQTEALVKKLNSAKEKAEPISEKSVDYTAELSRTITKRLGRRVNIINNQKTKKIEIEFTNDDDLNDIAEKLFGKEIFDDQI